MELATIKMHTQSLLQKLYWKKERKKIKNLIVAPRTEWMIMKWSRIEEQNRFTLQHYADELISDKRLYHDLDLEPKKQA